MKPDFSRLRSLTLEELRAPYPICVSRFQKENSPYCLDFINSRHSCGFGNPTFTLVRKAIELLEPKFIIVERLNPQLDKTLTIGDLLEHATIQERKGFVKTMEAEYTIYLAAQRNIPCMIGDPPWKNLFAEIRENKVISHDTASPAFLDKICNSKPYSKGNEFEKLHDELSLLRDRDVANLTAAQLKQHKHGLVVFGDGHLTRLLEVFEIMVGPRHILPLVPDRPLSKASAAFGGSYPRLK